MQTLSTAADAFQLLFIVSVTSGLLRLRLVMTTQNTVIARNRRQRGNPYHIIIPGLDLGIFQEMFMKKVLFLILLSVFLFAACSSVSVTHEDGSHTVLYPDGTMEHIN